MGVPSANEECVYAVSQYLCVWVQVMVLAAVKKGRKRRVLHMKGLQTSCFRLPDHYDRLM